MLYTVSRWHSTFDLCARTLGQLEGADEITTLMPTVTADAATNIRQDSTGRGFPWRPDPFITMLTESQNGGPAFETRKDNGSTENISDGLGRLQGKNVAIYFGGQWCPHCVTFKPDIAGYWAAAQKKAGCDALEVVYVSSDRDASAFNDYFGSMPKGFLAVPYADRDREKALSERFKVRGMPGLATVGILIGGNLNLANLYLANKVGFSNKTHLI